MTIIISSLVPSLDQIDFVNPLFVLLYIYNMFNFYDCLKIWTIKSSLQCNIFNIENIYKVYKIQNIYIMFGQKMGWVT